MSSSCSHDHSSCNHHGSSSSGDTTNHQNDIIKKLTTATWLCLAFLIIEVIGGYLAGSLAILSDAAHLFADLASFAVAVVAARLAALPTTPQHTFGLKRAESLAALLSMLSLAVVSIGLALEAIKRLYKNEGNVDGKMMTILATIGVFVNVALAMVLGVENHVHLPGAAHHGHDHGHDHQGHENDHHHCSKGKDHHHGHDKNHHHCNKDKGNDHHHHQEKTHHDHHTHSHSSHCEDHHHHHHDTKEDDDEESHNHNHSHDNKTITESTSLLGHHHQKEEKKSITTKKKKSSTNVNLQAAYLHVMGDLAQSFGVLIAGLLIWYNPNWYIMDPICTLIFCSVVFYSTLGVIRSSVSVLLEEVPSNVKWIEIFNAVQNVNGVTNVHDLHIWSISQGMPSMSVHCSVDLGENSDVALKRIYDAVKAKGIQHATIQIQIGKDCITCTQEPCNNEAGMNHIV